jgi:uncharacterized protein YegJ (DUF2314 family)
MLAKSRSSSDSLKVRRRVWPRVWHSILISGCTLLLCPGCNRSTSKANASDDPLAAAAVNEIKAVMLIDRENPDMQVAIRKARREVDDFLIALTNPRSSQQDFAVKAAFADGDLIEHMWLVDLKFEHGLLLGKLANQPELVSGFEKEGLYAVTPEEITDWYYYEEDQLVGGYSLDVLMSQE